MAYIFKPLSIEHILDPTVGDDVDKATIVRVFNNTNSPIVLTLKTSAGVTYGAISVMPKTYDIIAKPATDILTAPGAPGPQALLATKIAFRS